MIQTVPSMMASNASAGGWIYSEPHGDYYYPTYDSNGQITYVWAKQQGQQSQQSSAAAVAPTASYHARADSQQSISTSQGQWSGQTGNSAGSTVAGAEAQSPAPPVPQAVRATLPNFIPGKPHEGWEDQLDQSYRMRTGQEARFFFVHGRVFAMLYTETASATSRPSNNDDAFTVVRFGAHAYTQIRRFVVVSVRQNFVLACAISTYKNQGTFKRGCDPGAHALIYNYGTDPESCYFVGEKERGLYKHPIMVYPADNSARLVRESRIRFGKIYSIEWNVKVKDIGIVADQDLATLIGHYNEEERRYTRER